MNIYIYNIVLLHRCLDHRIIEDVQLCPCSRAMESRHVSGQVADSSIKLNFSLPSGRCETVSVLQSSTIADLKIAAQQSFGQRFLRLAAPDGRLFRKTPFDFLGFKMETALQS